MLITKMTENSLVISGVLSKEILLMDSQFKNAKCTNERDTKVAKIFSSFLF